MTRRLLLCLAWLALAMPGVLRAGANCSAAEVAGIRQAEELCRFDDAIARGLAVVSRDPNCLDAIWSLAHLANETGRMGEFLAYWSARDREGSAPVGAPYALSLAAQYAGEWAAASVAAERALAAAPHDTEIRRLSLAARRMDPAQDRAALEADYAALIADAPDAARVRLSLVNYFTREGIRGGRLARAVDAALAVSRPEPDAWVSRIDLIEEEYWYDREDALGLLQQGLRVHPDSRTLNLRLAQALRELGRSGDAERALRARLQRAPDDAAAVAALADLLASGGWSWEAAELLEPAIPRIRYWRAVSDTPRVTVASYLHQAGLDDDAVRLLRSLPPEQMAGEGGRLLAALAGKRPGDQFRLITDIPFVAQKGNYCGPATVSQLLGFWGRFLDQDAIAARVYTGVAGTAPQVIEDYAATLGLGALTFEGTDATWRRLIDAGYPVLWLRMLAGGGGHYLVVAGYDDVTHEWLLHNPHHARIERVPYGSARDEWILPSLRRSIVLFPRARASDPALAGIQPSFRLRVTNDVFYVATGSNLFRGAWPALAVNLLFAGLLLLANAALLRAITFPRDMIPFSRLLVPGMALLVPTNLLIVLTRSGEVVSVLLASHLALLMFLPGLLLAKLALRAVHDYFHPRESLGLMTLNFAVWLTLAFADRAALERALPVAIFLLGLPVLLMPRLRLRSVERALRAGVAPGRTLARLRQLGSEGRWFFAACCVELDLALACRDFARVRASVLMLRRAQPLSPRDRRALILYEGAAAMMSGAAPEATGGLLVSLRALGDDRRAGRHARTLARALIVLLDPAMKEEGRGDALVSLVEPLALAAGAAPVGLAPAAGPYRPRLVRIIYRTVVDRALAHLAANGRTAELTAIASDHQPVGGVVSCEL